MTGARLHRKIRRRIGAAAETAACIQHVDFDLRRLQAEYAGDHRLINRLELLAAPYFALVAIEFDYAVHRFHRGMREVGKLKGRFNAFGRSGHRCCGVAVAARDCTCGCGERPVLRQNLGGTQPVGGGFIPLDYECVATLFCRPEILRQHRHA